MQIKEINNYEDFTNLEKAWNKLLQGCDHTIFSTWEWLSTWWKHFGKDRKLLLLQVEEENRILAIAPLMLSKYKLRRFVPALKRIEFLGVPHSDYHNFIILEKAEECLKKIIQYLKREISGWNWIELREIAEPTLTAKLLQETVLNSSINLRKKKYVCSICPYMSLPESFDTFMKELSRKQRQSLNRNLRKLKRSFSVEFKSYKDFGFSVDEALKLFFRLHEMRWKEKGYSVFFEEDGNALKDFHLDIAKRFAENGWLGLYFLKLNDEFVAALYNFEYGKKSYGYLSGFDPAYSSYSIGNLALLLLIEESIKRGFREFDMLRGKENYKNYWTKTYRRNFEIRLVHRTPLSMVYAWITRTYSIE